MTMNDDERESNVVVVKSERERMREREQRYIFANFDIFDIF